MSTYTNAFSALQLDKLPAYLGVVVKVKYYKTLNVCVHL